MTLKWHISMRHCLHLQLITEKICSWWQKDFLCGTLSIIGFKTQRHPPLRENISYLLVMSSMSTNRRKGQVPHHRQTLCMVHLLCKPLCTWPASRGPWAGNWTYQLQIWLLSLLQIASWTHLDLQHPQTAKHIGYQPMIHMRKWPYQVEITTW